MSEAGAASPSPAAATLHQRIRADIEDNILSGAWPPGFRIPFEHELMARYGCARMTVSKVMAGLVASGLIERRRRAGSFVARPRIQAAVLNIPDIAAEIRQRGETYAYELISRQRRTARSGDPLAAMMPPGAALLALVCRHHAGSRPFSLEQRLINLGTVPEAAKADFARVPPGTWLLEHVPWTEAEHRIFACNADADMAVHLDLPLGTACLVVERRTWRAGETITFVRQAFPGDRYDLVARFAPSQG